MTPRDERLAVAENAVITVTRASRLLGFRGADAWLRERQLVRTYRRVTEDDLRAAVEDPPGVIRLDRRRR